MRIGVPKEIKPQENRIGLTPDSVQTKFISHLWSGHGTWKILLVGIHEDDGVLELFIVDHLVKLFTSIIDTIAIVRVDDKDDTLGVGIVMSPKLSDLVLTSDIPDVEGDILVSDLFYIKTDRRDGCHDFAKLKLSLNEGKIL